MILVKLIYRKFSLKGACAYIGDTLYRRMRPTVIFSFFVTGALRCLRTNLPFTLHQRTQYHSHNRYNQLYLCNGNRNATVVQQ